MKKYIKLIKEFNVFIIICLLFFNLVLTSTIQSFKCMKMTRTELFVNLPSNFVWKFKKCNK